MIAETSSVSAEAEGALACALIEASQCLPGFGIAVPQPPNLFAFYKSVGGALAALSTAGAFVHVERVKRHVDYLADRADCPTAVILDGKPFTAAGQVVLEALVNTATALRLAVGSLSEVRPEGIPADVFALILSAEASLAGWCSREKSLYLVRTILQERPKICVEIGVFGGRSLVPCAAALRHNGVGHIYGIETWSPDVAIENPIDVNNDRWWPKVDFPLFKHEFYRFIIAADLTRQVRLIEAKSARAAALFDQIDFLHIDGSHSIVNAAEDVILYAQKVRSGGIVVFDDIEWSTTAPAFAILRTLCDPVAMLPHPDVDKESCAIMRRR